MTRATRLSAPTICGILDFLHQYINQQKVFVLVLVDDFSRFITGGAIWDGERVAAVEETFMSAVSRHGRPEKAMSDGGSAFYSWRGVGAFTRQLDDLELDQLIASVPETNGKLEKLNATIRKEFFNPEKFFDLGETQRRFQAWLYTYNFRRTHHALGGLLVPADRYFGRSDQVMAAIEAGRSPDGIGEPIPVGERTPGPVPHHQPPWPGGVAPAGPSHRPAHQSRPGLAAQKDKRGAWNAPQGAELKDYHIQQSQHPCKILA